jgi:hypothetical protein
MTYNNENPKYDVKYCDNKMKFEDCEMAILRHAIDENEEKINQSLIKTDNIQKIITILEDFLIKKKLICYGGTAINNILPKNAQFYNRNIEIPDYDFFSPNAMEDAIELSNIYYNEGYDEVETKAGIHIGTYKVFVNFIPVADITFMHNILFEKLFNEVITVAGIKYAPPNFLRMSMYLELSRPRGDISRWEKVFKRLNILNKFYPLKYNNCNELIDKNIENDNYKKIIDHIRNSFIEQNVVFIGGFAFQLYNKLKKNADTDTSNDKNKYPLNVDVLSETPEKCAMILIERLKDNGFNAFSIHHPSFGEIIPEHYEIQVNKKSVACIYKTIGCHNYNTITLNGMDINVATIDTMLSFYLAFIYSNEYEKQRERILCMAQDLFNIQKYFRLSRKGLLKRFTMNCIGKQPTIEDIRHEKNELFKKLYSKKGTKQYDMYFLNYRPDNSFLKTKYNKKYFNNKTLKNKDYNMKIFKKKKTYKRNNYRKKKGYLF